MNNQIIVYITAILLGVVLNSFVRKLFEGVHAVIAFQSKNTDVRADEMNAKANKMTHDYIKNMIKLSVYFGARPDYALKKSCDSILDAARQISEQMEAREND